MSNEHEQSYGDTNVDWRQQEELEQQRWENDNNVATLLDSDPGYHAWTNARDADDAAYVAHVEVQAEIELERAGGGLTIEAWDR